MAVDTGYQPATYGADGTQVNLAYSRKPVISGLGSARTLTASESGAIVLLDRAAGIVLTLPAPVIGYQVDVKVLVSVTSNSYKVITSGASIFLTGGMVGVDTDSSNAVVVYSGDGASNIAVTMNGDATGGLKGTFLRFTCISLTQWLVEGMNMAKGTVSTPFANS